jgi:hypothetical protein
VRRAIALVVDQAEVVKATVGDLSFGTMKVGGYLYPDNPYVLSKDEMAKLKAPRFAQW